MKILIATGIFPPEIGGPATYVPFIAGELVRRGHAVRVVTYGSRSRGQLAYPVTRIPRIFLPVRYALFCIACVRYGFAADCIFAQDAVSSGIPAGIAAFVLRKRLIIKIVGDFSWEYARNAGLVSDTIDDFERRISYPFLVRVIRFCQTMVCRYAAKVVVPSLYLRGIVAGWGIAMKKIVVVYNAVEIAHYPTLEGRQRYTIFSAGRLVPWKGFDGLIRAFAYTHRAFPSARLVIAGDGPCKDDLLAVARATGVADAVLFLGSIAPMEMAAWYCRAGCFALFSSYEGFSHVLLEALSYGLPVIASDAGGNAEIIRDGNNGVVVASGDERALAAALTAFLKKPFVISAGTDTSPALMFAGILAVLEGV